MKKVLVALLCAAMLFSLAIPASAAAIPDGTMIYFEDFASYTNTTDTAATVAALKWRVLNVDDGNAYSGNTAIWTIEDGRLKVNNNITDGKDSCVKILDDEAMWEVCQGAFTLQYDVMLKSASDTSRYIVIVTHYAEIPTPTYNSFHLRIRGSANNQMHCAGSWYTFDTAGSYYAADTADGDGSSTVLFKVFGINYDNSYALTDKDLTIRVQNPPLNVYNDAMDGYTNYGPVAYIRDNGAATPTFVKVSAPSAEEHNDTGYMFWDTKTCEHSGIAIKAGGKIDGYVDNIMIWTGLVDQPANTAVTYTAPPMPATTEEVTTEAPEVTTKAPEATTKAPEATTAAPEATTAAPEATTAAPKPAEGGCGSLIGCGVALVALLGGCVVIKKRK